MLIINYKNIAFWFYEWCYMVFKTLVIDNQWITTYKCCRENQKCNALNKKDIVYFVVMEFIYTFA